jgi:hypothetical protein
MGAISRPHESPSPALRRKLEAEIDRLIDLLDAWDGDPDLEADEDFEPDADSEPSVGQMVIRGVSYCDIEGGDDLPSAPDYPDDPEKPQYLTDQWFI